MQNSTKLPSRSLVALAALGWLNAFYTLWHRQSLMAEGIGQPSFCNVGERMNCDTAALSSYSAFFGMPTSAFGLAFYSVVLLFAIRWVFAAMDRKEALLAPLATVLFALTAFALVPTLALAGISVFVLGTICLMCFGTYLINIGLVISSYLLMRRSAPSHKSFLVRVVDGLKVFGSGFWAATGLAVAISLFMPSVFDSSLGGAATMNSALIQAMVSSWRNEKVQPISVAGYPSHGAADAKITVVEYSDFQCPHCARAAMTLPPLIQGSGKSVRLVFKNYPLDAACNAAMKGGGPHQLACVAAKTGRCVHVAKGDAAFFAYADEVFQKQESITPEMLKAVALKSGIDGGALDRCLNETATQDAVVAESNEGTAIGVKGTPAIYVNGKSVEYGANPKVLKAILDSL